MSIKDKLDESNIGALFESILLLENLDECYNFFQDLCTVTELKAMAQRFQVAVLLNQQVVYSEIAEITGASTATISRVNKCLNYGEDGYKSILARRQEK